jgi:hypothetical protein
MVPININIKTSHIQFQFNGYDNYSLMDMIIIIVIDYFAIIPSFSHILQFSGDYSYYSN